MLQDMMKTLSIMKVRKFNPMKETIIVLFLAECVAAVKEENNQRHNLFQLHGIGSKLGPLLLEVDLKVLQLGLLHPLVQQRRRFLLLLLLQFSKKNDVLLQVQQPPLLHQLLHHLHIIESLFVTSVKVVGMLLLSVLVEEP